MAQAEDFSVDSLPVSIDELWDCWRRGPLRAPRSLGETFALLGLYHPDEGLDPLLDRIDFRGVPEGHNYRIVLNRPPESMARIKAAEGTPARQLFKHSLLSEEFQNRLIQLLLTAYPEKTRNLFLHIPKCAGTDLAVQLIPRYLPLARAMESKAWTSKEKMLDWIAGLVRVAPLFDDVLIYGHTFFGDYIRRVGTRVHDRIFTVVRDPVDLMLSQANYNTGLLRSDPGGTRPDTLQVMRNLEIETIPAPLSADVLRDLALKALLHPGIAQPNRICAYLGDGRADMTLNNLAVHNVEVSETRRYSDWIRQRWGIERSPRLNESRPIVTRADAQAHMDVLGPRIAEDQIVYDEIMKALDRSGQTSIQGVELAR